MPNTKDILIIDDESAIADFMAEALRDEGYTVRSALDGAHGLQEIATTRPALVFLDLHMPGITAGEFLNHMCTDGAANIPIVLMTASHSLPEELATRCAAHLLKPFDLDELLACVAQFIHPVLHRER